MNKANSDKRDDADILRAHDIVPPYNKKNQPSENVTLPVDEKKAESTGDVPAEAGDVGHKDSGIPKFDLAKQILAEQRRVTAVRRKAPLKAGPVRGPEEKSSTGAGVSKSVVAGAGKKTEPLIVEGQKVERDAVTACVGTSLPAGRKAGLPLQKQGQKESEMVAQTIDYAIRQSPPVPSEHEQIIAEIVARDIERLCGRLDA